MSKLVGRGLENLEEDKGHHDGKINSSKRGGSKKDRSKKNERIKSEPLRKK